MTEVTQSSDVHPPKNRLFVVAAIVLTLIVFCGFVPTYWIPVVSSSGSMPSFLHLHAALFFGWVVLFLLQAVLVARNQVAVHRRVGIAGALWAFATVVTGIYLAVTTIGRDLDLIDGTFGAVVTVIPLSQICMFACFIGLAIANTRKPDTHKRFIMLAALVAITPALARIVIAAFGEPSPIVVLAIFLVSSGLVVAVAWYDAVRNRRLHPVLLYGGLAILLVRILRVPFAMSPMWRWTAESMSPFTT